MMMVGGECRVGGTSVVRGARLRGRGLPCRLVWLSEVLVMTRRWEGSLDCLCLFLCLRLRLCELTMVQTEVDVQSWETAAQIP